MKIEVEHRSVMFTGKRWFMLLGRLSSYQWGVHTNAKFRDRARFWNLYLGWINFYFALQPSFGFRTRRWKERTKRFLLAIRPGPVYVVFSSFCCDTGNFQWATRFPNGFRAWQGTRWEALDGGDGPTHFSVLKEQEDIDYYFPPPCDHEYYAGPVGQCGVKICWKCGHHEGLARCFCGWSANGGDGARQLEAMGETL